MAKLNNPNTGAVYTQRLQVSDYLFPANDGSTGMVMVTDGFGRLTFTDPTDISGIVGGAGNGVDDRLVRWDGSEDVQNSLVALNDAGDLSGITTINVGGVTYPAADGTAGQVMSTNGAGVLTFTDIIDVSQVVGGGGSGVDERLMRWDGSEDAQNSVVALNDGGDMSGIVQLTATQVNAVNSNFSLAVSTSGNAELTVDTGTDLYRYDRTSNTHELVIGGTTRLSQTSALTTNFSINASLASAASDISNFENAAIATGGAIVSGQHTVVIASLSSTVEGNRNALIGTLECSISSDLTGPGDNCIAGSQFSQIGLSLTGFSFSGIVGNFIGGTNTSNITGNRNGMIGSDSCNIYGQICAVVGSLASEMRNPLTTCVISSTQTGVIDASAFACSIISSDGANVSHLQASSMIGCVDCSMGVAPTAAYQFGNVMLASNTTDSSGLADDYLVYGGVGGRTWAINSDGGSMHALSATFDGTVPDYAEFFENEVSGEIAMGSLVAMRGGKVHAADADETSIGVVSGAPGVVLGAAGFSWAGKYLRDEWNRPVKKLQPQRGWKSSPGQTEADHPQTMQLVLNPDYNPGHSYLSREERPNEWTKVGLVGQLLTRVDATIFQQDQFVKSKGNGLGTASADPTCIQVMRMTRKYNTKTKYGIALCLVLR